MDVEAVGGGHVRVALAERRVDVRAEEASSWIEVDERFFVGVMGYFLSCNAGMLDNSRL